eukprot:CAMPEP_0203677166 /NCGR_PEP_ID=MMETSP0090-20130426/27266_1 /ASSEMBLY_ACC=CAM_ASM_001088 /TAXON_ID=426623 /ORGANISM="Chaetoceros affinis, Strain CCMP159" /LENGTH=288 /DNA_ID=CAMNT_0050543971 /DNA_START=64 /DNA_END=927 /DNA_ORIENTATION=-
MKELRSSVRVEAKNTTNLNGGEDIDDIESFLTSTLASHLVESFSDDSRLSRMYTSDSSVFLNKTTPQGKAFDWLVNYDTFKGYKSTWTDPADNPTILQRYILAVLFFATEGVYNRNLGGMFTPTGNKVGSWTTYGTLNFLSRSHECSWKEKNAHGSLKGVKSCNPNTQEITELILPEAGLHGELPEEIGYLSNLVRLDVQNNHLGGTIPVSIGRLTSLKTLALSHNKLVSKIPSSMGSLTKLETLYVNYNHMEGRNSIPSSFCDLQEKGRLFNVWADCGRQVDPVECD